MALLTSAPVTVTADTNWLTTDGRLKVYTSMIAGLDDGEALKPGQHVHVYEMGSDSMYHTIADTVTPEITYLTVDWEPAP